MAHQFHDRQSSVRPVSKRFAPGRLAQACLVKAYARLVPPAVFVSLRWLASHQGVCHSSDACVLVAMKV